MQVLWETGVYSEKNFLYLSILISYILHVIHKSFFIIFTFYCKLILETFT